MKHCSVQVKAHLTRDELERYKALMEVGKYLESQKQFELAYTVQQELDYLVQPAVERLKEKSRQRDRDTEQYLQSKQEQSENGANK